MHRGRRGLGRWLAVALVAGGGPAGALTRGTAGADFLKVANGVRAVGMGAGSTAVGEDIYALYSNPAGIARLTSPESVFTYVKLFQASDVDGAYLVGGAVALPRMPLASGNAALGFMALTTGAFDSTDPQAPVRSAGGASSDVLAFATYSVPVLERWSAGGTVKYVRRSLTDSDPTSFVADPVSGGFIPTRSITLSAAGLGADVGGLWELPDHSLSLGGAVQNIGTIGGFTEGRRLNLGKGAEPLPVIFRAGAALRTRVWGQRLLTTADLTSFIDSLSRPRLSLGAEYGIAGSLFLRAGWEQPLDQRPGRTSLDVGPTTGVAALPSALRTGVGFRWPVTGRSQLQFDYALAPFGALGAVHHAALRMRWNIPAARTPAPPPQPMAVPAQPAVPAILIRPRELKLSGPPKTWKVEIWDDHGRLVRTFQGVGGTMPPKSIAWDGIDDRGRVVPNTAGYRVVLQAKDITDHDVVSEQAIGEPAPEPVRLTATGRRRTPAWSMPVGEIEDGPEMQGDNLRMIGVRYQGVEAALTDEHRVVLKRAAGWVAEHPGSVLTVEGYASGASGDEANYLLAKARAEQVQRALIDENGLDPSRVAVRVYGRSKAPPLYPNIPEEDQLQRVDLVIGVRR